MEKRKKKRPQHGHFLLAEGVSLGFLASLRCPQSSIVNSSCAAFSLSSHINKV
jgi:hypothetical protein